MATDRRCGQDNCTARGEFVLHWPGKEAIDVCAAHKDRAMSIAAGMDFQAHIEAYCPVCDDGTKAKPEGMGRRAARSFADPRDRFFNCPKCGFKWSLLAEPVVDEV